MKHLHLSLSCLSLVTLTTFLFSTTSCSKKGDDKGGDNNPGETVIFTENFDDASTAFWQPAVSGPVVMKVSGGFYSVTYTGTSASQYKDWTKRNLFSATDKKQAVEIAQQHVAGDQYDKCGLVFSAVDASNILGFQISNKEFRVYGTIGGTAKQLINWTYSTAIKGGLNEVNKLRVALADGKFIFYINGTEVGRLDAGTITSLDYVGIGMVKASTPETTYKIDYLKAITLK